MDSWSTTDFWTEEGEHPEWHRWAWLAVTIAIALSIAYSAIRDLTGWVP